MISDITLGQFFPGESPLHRLDPRTKIIRSKTFQGIAQAMAEQWGSCIREEQLSLFKEDI